ncbi:MAG: ricin-type beta-trefoil lectin domain protein [Pseudomonas sp.]|nr:ricin-type beta-trefoil lectin domain protein [Pseudomonas sp.]
MPVPPTEEPDDNQVGGQPVDPDDNHGNAPDIGTTPPVTPPAQTFAEPTGATDDEVNAVAFYDIDSEGQPRAVRHDLNGSLPAMVQFVQSHSLDPAGNAAKNMPTLTSEREALLLITPEPSLGKLQTLTLNATLDGQPLPALTLRSPNELLRSDYSNTDGRPDLTYSRRAWSVLLPWDWVKPGLSLSLTDEQGRNGQLAAEAIEFAAPAELVLHSIRVGMLTAPPQSGNHWLSLQPAKAATDYFQTVPVARITAAQYEDVQFNRVMVSSGAIYDVDGASHNPPEPTISPGEGGVYSGDMRGDTGKSTVSVGTNLANYGITSSSMASQSQPQLFQSVVAHHAAGRYSNGVQNHGLSGGNGMLTLYSSQGNEFSHEIGHHFGLGHYPGNTLPPKSHFWSNHHADSGWGLIGYRKRLRANVHWTAGVTANQQGGWSHQFLDLYSYAPDAMAGGSFASKLSRYTHYTGFSAKTGIQPRLDRAIPSSSSSTGYVKWNAVTRQMEELVPAVQNNSELFYNGALRFAKPQRIGVPVFTILGGYVAETGSAVLYPALRSNWGNVFDLPAPVANPTARQCWLSVDYANGSNQRIAVAGRRLGSVANKLHIQLAEDQQPTLAKLFCQTPQEATPVELASLTLPQNLPPMPAPVVVGKEAGYSAVRAVELPELDAALRALASKTVLVLSGNAQLLYDSYSDTADGLSAEARAVFDRYQDQQQRALRLNRWIDVYRAQLEQGSPDADAALRQLLTTLNFNSNPLLPSAVPIKNGSNCLKAAGSALQVLPAANCSGAASETWIIDARGAVHSGADPTQCLTNSGGIRLSACDLANNGQNWDLSQPLTLKQGSACMDLAGSSMNDGTGEVLMYGCHGGGNQKWSGLTSNPDNLLLPLVSRRNVAQIVRLAQTNASPAP